MLFSLPNCGDYDPILKPFGFGLASTIRINTERHEAGNEESHYLFRKTALERSENNPGLIMESFVKRAGNFSQLLAEALQDAVDATPRRA